MEVALPVEHGMEPTSGADDGVDLNKLVHYNLQISFEPLMLSLRNKAEASVVLTLQRELRDAIAQWQSKAAVVAASTSPDNSAELAAIRAELEQLKADRAAEATRNELLLARLSKLEGSGPVLEGDAANMPPNVVEEAADLDALYSRVTAIESALGGTFRGIGGELAKIPGMGPGSGAQGALGGSPAAGSAAPSSPARAPSGPIDAPSTPIGSERADREGDIHAAGVASYPGTSGRRASRLASAGLGMGTSSSPPSSMIGPDGVPVPMPSPSRLDGAGVGMPDYGAELRGMGARLQSLVAQVVPAVDAANRALQASEASMSLAQGLGKRVAEMESRLEVTGAGAGAGAHSGSASITSPSSSLAKEVASLRTAVDSLMHRGQGAGVGPVALSGVPADAAEESSLTSRVEALAQRQSADGEALLAVREGVEEVKAQMAAWAAGAGTGQADASSDANTGPSSGPQPTSAPTGTLPLSPTDGHVGKGVNVAQGADLSAWTDWRKAVDGFIAELASKGSGSGSQSHAAQSHSGRDLSHAIADLEGRMIEVEGMAARGTATDGLSGAGLDLAAVHFALASLKDDKADRSDTEMKLSELRDALLAVTLRVNEYTKALTTTLAMAKAREGETAGESKSAYGDADHAAMTSRQLIAGLKCLSCDQSLGLIDADRGSMVKMFEARIAVPANRADMFRPHGDSGAVSARPVSRGSGGGSGAGVGGSITLLHLQAPPADASLSARRPVSSTRPGSALGHAQPLPTGYTSPLTAASALHGGYAALPNGHVLNLHRANGALSSPLGTLAWTTDGEGGRAGSPSRKERAGGSSPTLPPAPATHGMSQSQGGTLPSLATSGQTRATARTGTAIGGARGTGQAASPAQSLAPGTLAYIPRRGSFMGSAGTVNPVPATLVDARTGGPLPHIYMDPR